MTNTNTNTNCPDFNGYTNHDTFMAAVIMDNDLTVYSGLDDIHSPDDLARWVAVASTETNIYVANVNWQELYDRLLEDRAETQRIDAKSRDCANGNHSVCSASSCSCSCHKSSPQKDYSGACADGDHDACKMTPGAGPDECACPHHDYKENNTMTDPIYTISPDRSGIGFALPDTDLRPGEAEIPAAQVDPDIRAQGQAWLATQLAK